MIVPTLVWTWLVRSVLIQFVPSKRSVKSPVSAEIGVEILPVQPVAFAVVDVAAGDRVADAVIVERDRVDEGRVRARSFGNRPAVVRTFLAEVDFLDGLLADIGKEKRAAR